MGNAINGLEDANSGGLPGEIAGLIEEIASSGNARERKKKAAILRREIERKIASAERRVTSLQDSERHYRTLIAQAREAIIVTDFSGTVIYRNPQFIATFGFSPEDIEVLTLSDFIHPDDLPMVTERHNQRLRGLNPPDQYDLRCLTKKGEIVHIQVSARAYYSGGKPAGTIDILRDVTEERKSQARLARAEKMASLGILYTGLVHEINNPINAARVNLQVADKLAEDLKTFRESADAGKEPDYIQEDLGGAIEDALTSTESVIAIIKSLLPVLRDDETPGPVAVSDSLETALALVKPSFRGKIALAKKYSSTPRVTGTRAQLNQVFMNLLTNASRAVARNGEILLTTRSDAGAVVIEIADSGPGIGEGNEDRVFSAAYSSGAGGGLGLGLSISKDIVEGLGGSLKASNRPAGGAVFTVRLPAAKEERPGN